MKTDIDKVAKKVKRKYTKHKPKRVVKNTISSMRMSVIKEIITKLTATERHKLVLLLIK